MASFPEYRPRRLRRTEALRGLMRETRVSAQDLVLPLFVVPGSGVRRPVVSMPGVFNTSVDETVRDAREAWELGIPAVLLFGIPPHKDEVASGAFGEEGIVQQAVRALKQALPDLLVITDVCLCEYTSHGHCGFMDGEEILNDPTVEQLARTALSHAGAGTDIVAPSDTMDGRVGAIREALDDAGFAELPILSYAAKFASSFYGPFREAAESTPSFGDRRSYQMDPANRREAMREMTIDLDEAADMLLIKPAIPSLDLLAAARERFEVPIGAYQVSGEYAQIEAAARLDWIDRRRTHLEALTSIVRAGAGFVITYAAAELAGWLREGTDA